jgi:U3 small nucleolar RNA-associated protein 13
MRQDTRQPRRQGEQILWQKSTSLTPQIWALAVSSDEKTIVSAGADSVATIWEDSTEVEQAEKNDALVKAVQRCVMFPSTFRIISC